MTSLHNSLSFILNVPQRKPRDLSAVKLPALSAGVVAYAETSPGLVNPELECGEFYVLNHLLSRAQAHFHPDEPLPEWAAALAKDYRDVLVSQSRRLLSYLLLIITRESRHQHTMDSDFISAHKEKFGDASKALLTYHREIIGMTENTAVAHVKEQPLDISAATYVDSLSFCFHNGGWSTNYGGHPWGDIADCLFKALTGVYSLEVMVDLGYALAHNGGPIFNKGMLYTTYGSDFLKVLDLQRAGMLPALLLSNGLPAVKKAIDPKNELTKRVKFVQDTLGGLPTEIDYVKVHAFCPAKSKAMWEDDAEQQKKAAAKAAPKAVKAPAIKTYTNAILVAPSKQVDAPPKAAMTPETVWNDPEGKTLYIHPNYIVKVVTRD